MSDITFVRSDRILSSVVMHLASDPCRWRIQRRAKEGEVGKERQGDEHMLLVGKDSIVGLEIVLLEESLSVRHLDVELEIRRDQSKHRGGGG